MKVGVPKETTAGERRVGLVPDGVTKLAAAGLQVSVQAGAGAEAFFTDEAYQKAGATLVPDARALFSAADAVLKLHAPSLEEVSWMHAEAISISFLQPSSNAEVVKALARQRVTAFSLELVPRISRAQSMDALSSQAGVSGYKSVLMAANRLGKFFPLLITAAGTVTPARVLVLGASRVRRVPSRDHDCDERRGHQPADHHRCRRPALGEHDLVEQRPPRECRQGADHGGVQGHCPARTSP